ncbi:MAG: hypothetical protein RLZZ301_1875 [Bacteroidota bacterium]|jgi:hypothetical protein
MSALTILGYCCLILIFGGVPIYFIVLALKDKPDATPESKEATNTLQKNRANFWEYFILILPIVLIGIALLSPDIEEQRGSIHFLAIGLPFFQLSFNNRIDVPGVNRIVLAASLLCGLTSFYLSHENKILPPGDPCLVLLWYPIAIYCYLKIARELINAFTGTYPFTVSRSEPVGYFSELYQREANYWDLLWTFWNFGLYLSLLFCSFYL